jgi:hypothetical protein
MDYRTCFSTKSGRVVLTDLLIEAGFFDTALGFGTLLGCESDVAVENFVKKILYKLGIYNVEDRSQYTRFVDKLFELPVEIENGKKRN